MRYLALAESEGHPRLASIQNGYSLLDRYFELGLAEIAMREGVGLIGYSPLARGLLTGKHLSGGGSGSTGHPMLTPNRHKAVSDYVALAREHGLDPSHMALAFACRQPFTASVLMAASSVSQLTGNLGAIGIELPKDVIKAINTIHDFNPNPK
jgi:aryl-alcohol dehydrogenase-like predicted oxidoreductase